MASTIATSSIQQQPPSYILQSWHREQLNPYDNQYLLEQKFVIAPDAMVPFSRLRQRIRNIYEQRAQAVIIVHYDPWNKSTQVQTVLTPTEDLVKSHTTL